MGGNWHAAGQIARDHQDELAHRAAQSRLAAGPARRSPRDRVSIIVALAARIGRTSRPAGPAVASR